MSTQVFVFGKLGFEADKLVDLNLRTGLSGDKAFLAKFNAGQSMAMSGTLSLNVGLTDAYNNRPPQGTKSNDVGLFTGLDVKFGAN